MFTDGSLIGVGFGKVKIEEIFIDLFLCFVCLMLSLPIRQLSSVKFM